MQIDESILAKSQTNPVILYDGSCLFCSHALKWVLKRDKLEIFWFSYLKYGEKVVKLLPDTVILVQDRQIYTKSDAALKVLQNLGGYYSSIAKILKLVPLILRNWVYDIIAKYRYLIKKDINACQNMVAPWKTRIIS